MSGKDTAPLRRRRLVRTAATVALAAAALLPVAGPAPAATKAPKDDTVAVRMLDDIVKGHYKAATAHFDATMRRHLPPDRLEQVWKGYQAHFGRYRSHQKPTDTKSGRFTVVSVPLRMQHGPGEFRVSFDKKGSVGGLFFLRPGVPIPKQPPT